jgi:hypothetical protein
MTPLATLDAALTAAIRAGTPRFAALVDAVRELAQPHAPVDAAGHRDVEALVERRLQVLRSAGTITLQDGGWRISAVGPDLQALEVRSRRLGDYLLLDLGQAQAWRPSARPGQPAWRAVLPNPVATLQALAEGRARHADAGACPTAAAPAARDPACPVCQALEALGRSTRAVRSAA